jgi:hypothetical protein
MPLLYEDVELLQSIKRVITCFVHPHELDSRVSKIPAVCDLCN